MLAALPDVQSLRSAADRVLGRREATQGRLEAVKADIKALEDEQTLLDLVAALLRKYIDQEVTEAVGAAERLLTRGLQAVFNDQDLRVRGDVEVQRGKVAVNLVTIQKRDDGIEIEGLSSDAFGGSVATVESVLLRVFIILRRKMRRVLFLDESLPAFDANYVANMGVFLSALCAKLKLDILLVTHNTTLMEAAQHGYRIVRKKAAHFEKVR